MAELVDDLQKLPKGTRTVIIGYSLGANATAFVANKTYVDLIIALQPSMLSWNPPITGKVGRMIEVYNPNPWLTFGGMGSKKLIGPNIEYVENTDSHPGAQFNGEFRTMVKTEIAKITAGGDVVTAQAEAPQPKPPKPDPVMAELPKARTKDLTAFPEIMSYAETAHTAQKAKPAKTAKAEPVKVEHVKPQPIKPEPVVAERPKPQPSEQTASALDSFSTSAASGSLQQPDRQLTASDMLDYAKRRYQAQPAAAAAGN